jgi:hypothetical protein
MKPITLHYSEVFLRRVLRAFWWRKTGLSFFGAVAMLVTSLGYFVLHGDRSWWVGVLGAMLVFVLGVSITVYIAHRRGTLSRFRRMRTPSATFEFDDERFRLTSDVGTSELAWSTVTEIWQFTDFWLLFFSPAQFVTLPLADLDDAARNSVIDRLRAHGSKIK